MTKEYIDQIEFILTPIKTYCEDSNITNLNGLGEFLR